MKEYSIYCIKNEFAEHYFYKSDILYRFIKSYHQNRYRKDLNLQFNHITNRFTNDIVYHIFSQLKMMDTIQIVKKDNQLEFNSQQYYLSLYIYKKQLKFRAESLYEAELMLFPALRLFHPYLFIIESYFNDYGWIAPDKNHLTLMEGKQLLYSYP